MKRILIFSLAYYPQVGGAEVAIKEITDRITDIEFHMVTMRFSRHDLPEEKIGNVTVHRVGIGAGYLSKIFFIPRAVMAARRLQHQQKFDGAWAMMSYMLLPLVLLRLMGVHMRYAVTLQEGDTYDHMFKRLRILPFVPFINYGFRHANIVQAISIFLGNWAIEKKYTGPLEIIPNGVDVAKFAGEKIPHESIILITTSRLVHKNAVDDIIRALALLPKEIRLVVVGEGKDNSTLKKLADTQNVSERIQWLGYIDNAKLPELLHEADIFVRPSRSEGMGNSFIEAMAAELPVIATQEGGLKDFITPEVAWPVEKDRPEQIALQIKAIMSNPEHTKQVVNTARKMVTEKYDWSLIARVMREKVFARLFV